MIGRVLAQRLVETLGALFIFSLIVFGLSRASGDPIGLLLPPDTPADIVAEVRHTLGLDAPLPVQLGIYYRDMLTLNFGNSLRSRLPVRDLIAERLPASLQLGGFALLWSVLLAFPVGVVSAARRGSRLDTGLQVFVATCLALPGFWFGLLLIGVFAVSLRLLPAGGSGSAANLVLPGITMVTFLFASLARLLRSSLLEVMGSQYVTVARAKGLAERVVLWRHALRNALIPVVTFGGTYVVTFISSAIVIETVFAWPGIGRLTLDALQGRDYPVMQALMLLTAALTSLVNLAVDLSYTVLDPRIRLGD